MKSSSIAAVLALATLPSVSGHPTAQWRFQRIITPAPSSPEAEQCVVLDAALYANSARGLRDVRLLQDGRELAYAVDESHDEAFEQRSTSPPPTDSQSRPRDRALYETSMLIPAHPSDWPAPPGNGDAASLPEHPPGSFFGQGLLPAHVPVERIRLVPEARTTETLSLRAAQQTDLKSAETFEGTLAEVHPAADFTIGANLQVAADVRLRLQGGMPVVQAFVLEMRRRDLCYQPLSPSPLVLLSGNANARPVHYDYAAHFHPSATPLLATLGPMQTNPDFREPLAHALTITRRQRFLLASGVAAIVFLFTVTPLLRRH